MRTLIERYALPRLLALLFSALVAFQPAAFGQDYAKPAFTQQELDQMLAPVALYPDPLLSQILMASTYPLEVVEAARWSRDNRGLHGDEAVRAVAEEDWDPSVKSLVAFPQILAMMDQNLGWTERLGEAFLAQEPHVMETVQSLRQRAYAEGNLKSNDRIRVESQGRAIVIEPARPQVVYVPYYDPLVVYGPWSWPAYPPVHWAPWPGYYAHPGYPGFAWGSGIGVSAGFFFGAFDWHQHHVRVVHVNNHYYKKRTVIVKRDLNAPHARVTRNVNVAPGAWRHDPAHRRGVPYRVTAVRERFAPAGTAADARRDFRGSEPALAPAPAPVARSLQENQLEMRGADARTRLRDNQAPSGSRPEMRGAAPRPDSHGAAVPEERRRDKRGAEAGSSNRGGPAHRSDVRGSRLESSGETAVRPADPPTVERPSAPPSQPIVERQPRAPAPLPQANAPVPQTSAIAPAQRSSSIGAAVPEDRRRDKRGAEAGTSNRGGPAHRSEVRGSRHGFSGDAAVRAADRPAAGRPRTPLSQPAVERQPRAPAPLPQANFRLPQTSAIAPAQRSSSIDRGSRHSGKPRDDGRKPGENRQSRGRHRDAR